MPLDEVAKWAALPGSEINKAKEVLAYELTKLVHGEAEADKALKAAKALFAGEGEGGSIPTSKMTAASFENGMPIIDLLECTGLPDAQRGPPSYTAGRNQNQRYTYRNNRSRCKSGRFQR